MPGRRGARAPDFASPGMRGAFDRRARSWPLRRAASRRHHTEHMHVAAHYGVTAHTAAAECILSELERRARIAEPDLGPAQAALQHRIERNIFLVVFAERGER